VSEFRDTVPKALIHHSYHLCLFSIAFMMNKDTPPTPSTSSRDWSALYGGAATADVASPSASEGVGNGGRYPTVAHSESVIVLTKTTAYSTL